MLFRSAVAPTLGSRRDAMPSLVTQKNGRLEKRSEMWFVYHPVLNARIYSAEISIGARFGRLGSRPRPAALSDSSIVYAGSFSCFSRRL